MLVMLIIVGGGVIALLVHNNSRRSRGAGTAKTPAQAANMPGMSVAETVTLANRQLLSADEQVRSAADELDFARAQFGIAATDEFARTLEAARAAVARGFERQKQMEDATGDAEKRSIASAIMRDLGENMNPLSAVQAAFEQRRSEQATLPSRITEASERLVEQRGDLERATAELAAIAGIYPAQMLTSLQDNPEQAHALLETAASAIEAAKQAVDTDRALAESTLDTAHRALMMAKHQTDAIFSAKSDLDAIRDRLGAAIGSISADLADVTSLRAEPAVFDPLVADARAAIAEGQAALMNNGDPLAALEHLRTSEANIDAALAPLRSRARKRREGTRERSGSDLPGRNRLRASRTLRAGPTRRNRSQRALDASRLRAVPEGCARSDQQRPRQGIRPGLGCPRQGGPRPCDASAQRSRLLERRLFRQTHLARILDRLLAWRGPPVVDPLLQHRLLLPPPQEQVGR